MQGLDRHKRLLLRYDVSLCCGHGCPKAFRESCYRYQLHHFFDCVAKNVDFRELDFIDPACEATTNGRTSCKNHQEIKYINKQR